MTGPLTADERRFIGEYVRAVADRMGLRDWTVEILHDEPTNTYSPNAAATVDKIFGRRVAEIAFRGSIRDEEPDSVRHCVVHELTHLPFEPIGQYLNEALKGPIGWHFFNPFSDAYRALNEEATDHIATVLAPFMPAFPGWPKDADAKPPRRRKKP